jgi:hypothetical protein
MVVGGEAEALALLLLLVGIRLAGKVSLKQDHAGSASIWIEKAQLPIPAIYPHF